MLQLQSNFIRVKSVTNDKINQHNLKEGARKGQKHLNTCCSTRQVTYNKDYHGCDLENTTNQFKNKIMFHKDNEKH